MSNRRAKRPAVRVLNVGYHTPEWRYAVDDLSPFVGWAIALPVYGAWAWGIVWANPFAWSGGQQLVAAIAGVAGAYVVALHLNEALARRGGGYGLAPRGTKRLRAEFTRGRFRILIKGRWRVFDARVLHSFAMREHRLRHEEARAAERARIDGAGQRPDHYARAWEIVLDYGRERYVLAAACDEHTARKLIRDLQELDEFACGLGGAGSQTREDGGDPARPTGNRPQMD